MFTGASLLIQLIPVAPPRLLPMTGMVDTAVQYGQSVYAWSGGFDADEFSAMPSVHVGWAIIVAIAVITVSRRRWRWLAAAYPVLTLLLAGFITTGVVVWFRRHLSDEQAQEAWNRKR